MRLPSLTALPHVDGNRIDLTWRDPAHPAEVRIRRATGSHPTHLTDGAEVTDIGPGPSDGDGDPTRIARDTGLQGETVYYYTLFTKATGEADFTADPHNRVSAMATASYGFGAQMFAMLPAVYHRYDATLTNRRTEEADRDKGVLRRFLDLTGGQLDQLYSLTRAALDLHDLDRVEGALLPLLAQWIGWRTDYAAPVRTQRREIRHASEIYQRIGTVAALDATSRRVTGLRFQAKEFVHNIARTNEPERLNLWAVTRGAGAAWSDPELVSINHAFEGRPAYAPESDGDLVFYQTRRRHGAAQQASETAVHSWDIWAKKRAPDGMWSPSRPVVSGADDDRHPAVARFADRLWLFWETVRAADPNPRRRISVMTRPAGGTSWSPITVSGGPGAEFLGRDDTERRRPATAVDDSGGLWLFWQESTGDRWEIKYNRHDGTDWQLAAPKTLPQQDNSRIHDDLYVLARPGRDPGLYLFGAHQAAEQAAGGTRWAITYRVKATLDPGADDWQESRTLPKPPGAHDREPAPSPGANGRVELFFSTTRTADAAAPPDGRWSVFRSELLDPAANTWASVTPAAVAAASQRAPLAIRRADATVLVYRSSQPLRHTNALEDTATDFGCVGSTTFRGTRAVTYGSVDDIQTYTYTAPGGGTANDGRISREAVGLFLIPPAAAAEPTEIQAARTRLRAIVDQYLPNNTRAIFPVDR